MKITAPERLRILLLEDDSGDAALIQSALAKTTPMADVRWARARADFVKELADFSPHLVLADDKLPGFDALSALSLVQDWAPEIAFIFISRTISEEMAVEALKCGATDYVRKDDLERLEIVLARALRERHERNDRLKAEAALRSSQAQLQQSQKMEALGCLSGGIAHDFNNILTAITGYSELILMNPKLEEGLRADIQEILNAAFRAAALTRQLLAFSRRQIFTPKIIDLNVTLAELDRMLQRIIGEDVKLAVLPGPSLLRVRVDADQIGQVILNLVVNARDAMPGGGTLTLQTSNVELAQAELHAQPDIRPGRFVRLVVVDSGTGMDAETMSRIFEPFFTTKSKDKGTGLGLSTVYGIVKQSSGFITVDSRPGAGTSFAIYLPAVDGALDAVGKPSVPQSLKGSETILVVDDDAPVGLVMRRMLESHGYTVIEALGGTEALRLCGDVKTPLHLVLTDVVMAQMSGPEFARRIKEVRPTCKVLFVSGYAKEGILKFTVSKENFISKPFTVEDLLQKVRGILDCPSPP
ncbi:MAG: response regulator [Elusimicrobiota bacterium]